MAIHANSFPASKRIRKRPDYLACQEQGKKWHSPHFTVTALFLDGQPVRYGMAVSKKIGNAVIRNRVKRRLREFFRLSNLALTGWQIVVIAKKDSQSLTFAEINHELTRILHSIEKFRI